MEDAQRAKDEVFRKQNHDRTSLEGSQPQTSSQPESEPQVGLPEQDSGSNSILEEGTPTGSSVLEPNSVLAEDGRTYQSYDDGKYFLPNDGEEQDRLDLQHALCRLLLKGQFGWAPFTTPPREVLDLATGTGIWALEFARQNPTSHVVGTDLSLIQPRPDVPNCEFIRENSETADWIFPYFFDYIHIRFTVSCFDDSKTVIEKAFSHLQPGAWVELFDPVMGLRFENDPEKKSIQYRWFDLWQQAFVALERQAFKPTHYKEWLQEYGFVAVEEKVILCPTNPWPRPLDRRMDLLGRFARADWKKLLPGIGKIFQAVGIFGEELDKLNLALKEELDAEKVHSFLPYYVVYGRKPLEEEMTDAQKVDWEAMKAKIDSLRPSYPTPP